MAATALSPGSSTSVSLDATGAPSRSSTIASFLGLLSWSIPFAASCIMELRIWFG